MEDSLCKQKEHDFLRDGPGRCTSEEDVNRLYENNWEEDW